MKNKITGTLKNGRYSIYIDNLLNFCFNQHQFIGIYSYRTDTSLYGIDIYLKDKEIIELEYESRTDWENIIKVLDKLI